MMKVFFNSDYVASPFSFETTRKSADIARNLVENNIHRLHVVDPKELIPQEVVDEIIDALHDPAYINALKTGEPRYLAEGAFDWGTETYDFARAHSHGIMAAIVCAMKIDGRSGSLSSGLHHAEPGLGKGFCTVNGLAVGAAYITRYPEGKRRALILDFDAHCGGGTYSHIVNMEQQGIISRGDIVQIDYSVSPYDRDFYDVDGRSSNRHYAKILSVRNGGDNEYIDTLHDVLDEATKYYSDDMVVLYNAGVDPVNSASFRDPFGVIEQREKIVSEWIDDKPAVFTLAGGYKSGGYTTNDITTLHRYNIDTWASWVANRHGTAVR